MLTVYLESGSHEKLKIFQVESPTTGQELSAKLGEIFGTESNNYFFKHNGCLVGFQDVVHDGNLSLEPKLFGGKGGFGSMLRAIGAQIEKTTNREACRDLSGRRLRDINEEKRLKDWLEKQSTRDEEAAERKKKKLAKLCAEPKHEFKDKSYEEQRSALAERVEDAVAVGFAAASTSSAKRAAEMDIKANVKKKKTILDLDDDIDSDDLESSDESGDEKETMKNQSAIDSNKSDTENSSDVSTNCAESKTTIDSNSTTENSSDASTSHAESSNEEKKIKIEDNSNISSTAQTDDTSR